MLANQAFIDFNLFFSVAHFPRRQPAGQSQAARRLSDLSVLLHHLVAGDLAFVDVNSGRDASRAKTGGFYNMHIAHVCVCVCASTTNLQKYCIIINFTMHPAHPHPKNREKNECRVAREQIGE